MRICKKGFRTNSSGQLLIVTALAIAILIFSTTIYVYERSTETNNVRAHLISDFIIALKQGTRNTMISSLANVSNSGQGAILTTNLNRFSEMVRNRCKLGTYYLTFTPINNSRYDSGIWLSWGTIGSGVSSAYVNFTLEVHGIESNVVVKYAFNMSTSLTLEGHYKLEGSEKQVNLTCRVFNEGEYALAKNITLLYEDSGNWIIVNGSNNLSITDYCNGTYAISFNVNTSSDTLLVSARVHDLRDVFVQVNATAHQLG